MAKKWSDVAASSAFQALSLEEQEEARNQYFASVIAPQVPEEDLSVARDQFFATTSVPKAAPVAATGQRDRVDNPLNPNPKRGIIDSVLDFFKPAPKSVMDGYVAPPSTVPLIQQRGAPLSDKKFNELREVYDNATPQDRKKLIDSSKPVYKSAFKAIDDQYRRVDEKNNRGTVGNVLGTRPIDSRIENRLTLDEIEAINDPMAAQRRDFAKENPFVSAIASGSASAVSGAINIPSVAADFLNQSVVNPILRSLDLPELGRAPTMFGTEYLTKSARDYMPEIGRKSMMGAWNRDEFAKWLGVKLAANSPQIAQSLAAAFAPPLRAVLLPGMAGTAAGQSFVEGDDSRVAVAKGGIEYITEKLPLQVFDKIGDILKNMGPTKSSTVLAVASQRLLKAGGTITANGLTNAIEETAAQLGGNALDKYFQGKDIELTNGLAEAAVVGAATGKTMSVPQVVSIAQGTYEPDTQIARALDEGVASTDFVAPADQVARDRLNPNTYDSSLIDPSQTRIPQVTNFTPADSPSAQAGLAPIIVPEPTIVTPTEIPQVNPVTEQQFGLDQLSAGGLNVGTDSNAGTGVGLGGIAGSDQLGGSVGVSGLGIDSTNRIGGDAGIPAANVGADVVARGTAGEQSPAIARLPQLDQRATDQDLLARVQSAIAPQENNNANTQPTQQWFGRKGDGYVTEADAQQALPGRQRMFPNLNWSVEQMPSGKYRLAGYSQETTNVATPAQTQQAEAQGQEAPAALARQPESSIDLALQQAPLPDTVFAELSSNPGSADTRAAVQSHLDDLVARGVIAEAPKLGAPDADAEATVNVLGNLIGDATGLGQRVVPYKEVGGTNGFAVQGTAFVNTWFDPDSVSAGRTTFHEIRHVAEQIAAADTKAGRTNTPAQIFTAELDSIFDDIKDEGKRAYVENFLHKDELDAISDPAEREAKLQEFLTSPLLRSEMVADFLGNRATDRAFLVDLARQDPGGFEGFVKKWLAVIDNMIAKLRGGKTQGQKESAKVDQYIRDLNVAKMIARDALIEFRKGNFEQQEASQQSVQQESQPVAESKREAGIDPQPASKADMRKAAAYEKENGILPYTSEGQLEVPVNQELPRFSIKQQGKYGNHPLFDIPVNANGTVTMYYPTTNAEARRVAKDKTLRAAPGSNRIYLTNESSAPKVMGNRGNITQEMEGANVLVQVDPSLLQLDMEHSDGRKDFFIPIAEGKAFFDKMRMTRLFTQNAPRSKALTKDTKLTDLERRITDGVNKYLSLTKGEQRIALKEAKAKLKREHNVTTLLGVNGKLEKTNTGGYGLNNYDGKDVKSMGLGLASAQKINENNLSTCPKSAICESLCLGETSGQNLLYGGDGQYKSGPRLAQYLKTEAMVVNPEAFAVVLHSEIAKLARDAKKEDYQATVRLNVTSDFRPQTFAGIINAFPDVMFYDYTKLPSKSIAENHHLTYSSTGASQVVNGKTIVNPESNWNKMVDVMRRGDNVAMAFSDKNTMPKYVVDEKSGERFQVWNGDNYDARFLDPKPGQEGNEFGKGMIIGLTNKDRTGKPEEAAEKNKGFFVDYNPERDGDTVVIKNQDILAGGIKFVPINEIKTAKAAEKEDAPAFSKRQTDTPEFKRWFGDSKVVDANGEPLVVYHGTTADFSVFDRIKATFGRYGAGFYFGSANTASNRADVEGGSVMPVYLNISNPAPFSVWSNLRNKMNADKISAEDMRSSLEADGYDGLILPLANGNKEYVAFRPEQIKSATGNIGAFDPDNADIRYSKRQQPIQGQQFYLKGETRTAEQRRIFQDYFLRMKEVQDAIAEQGGVIDEAQDVYLAEALSYGRLQEQLTDFKEQTVKPMLAKLRAAKLETSDLALYAYAMHAKERNAAMSSRNARLKSDEGSGMTDKEADDIIDAYRQDGKLKDLQDIHKDLMAITSTTRLVLLDEGLISQEEFDAYENQYSYYVPLRGFITDESDLVSGEQVRSPRVGGGKGFNIRGKETVRALGRTSRAGHIIENIISDYERAIARAERNNVAKKFLDLVTTNPDPDLWQIDAERTTASLNKQTGMVQYNKLIDKGEDTISVKIDGKEVYIKINDPLLVRAMRAAGKDETGEVTKFLVNTIGWYGNLMRNTLTRFNPAFGVTNAIKDFGFSSVSMLADLGPKGMALFWKNYANPKQSGPIYEEFRAAGATTGGWHMRNTKDMQKELRTMMTWEGGSGVKFGTYRAAKGLLNTLEWVGQYSETQARFAAYKAARDMGLSPARAASIAKEVSTNFNRKGEWGSAMNTAYVFFNAGVQGSAKTLKNLRSPYVMGAMAGLTGLSTALAFMGASVGGDDDDEQAYWDKIPDEIKQRNIIIMLPPGDPLVGTGYARVGSRGRYIKIPIQYGLNVFSTLGYQIADVIRHVENKNRGKSVGKAAINMTSVTFGAFNPIGGAFDPTKPVDVALAAAPSIVDVAIQFAAGVDAFGRPTSPAKSPFDQKPDSENYSPAMAGSWEQRLTTWLNANTGGDQAVAGAIDLAPGTVRNMVRNVTGGAGDFLSSVFVNLPSKMLDPAADIKSSDIPILKALYGEADESTDLSEYYQRRADVMKAADEAGRRAKLGIKFDYDEENVGLQSLGKAAKVYTDLISELRKREIEIGTDQSLSKSEITQMRKDIQRERVSVARDFNNLFMQMKRDVEDKKFLSKEILEYEPSEWVADKAADYKVERREKLRDNKDRAAGLMD